MIKVGLGKALGFSLLAFIGLNFLFVIIAGTIDGTLNLLFGMISSDPLSIIGILFGPIVYMPGTVVNGIYATIYMGTFDSFLITFIGYLVSPFVAALVAGRTGDSKGGSFGGWMIAALISSGAMAVLAFIQLAPIVVMVVIIGYILSGVVNGIFYGCFALLFSKAEMY